MGFGTRDRAGSGNPGWIALVKLWWTDAYRSIEEKLGRNGLNFMMSVGTYIQRLKCGR
jgi:hypothetical protein